MESATHEALLASIAKWERNAVAETPAEYLTMVSDCPLCGLFWGSRCTGCPVNDRTGQRHCRDTPYGDADKVKENWGYKPDSLPLRAAAHAAAHAEVAFLKSLLPDDTAP